MIHSVLLQRKLNVMYVVAYSLHHLNPGLVV